MLATWRLRFWIVADIGTVVSGGSIVVAVTGIVVVAVTGIVTTLVNLWGERRRADERQAQEFSQWLRQERARAFANAVAAAATVQHLASNIHAYTRVRSDQRLVDARDRALESINEFNTAIAHVRIVADLKFHSVVGDFTMATVGLLDKPDGEEGPDSKYAQQMQRYTVALAAFTMAAREQLGMPAG